MYSEQLRVREQRVEELAEKRLQIVLEAERAKRKELSVMRDEEDEWVSSVFLHQEKVKVEVINTPTCLNRMLENLIGNIYRFLFFYVSSMSL